MQPQQSGLGAGRMSPSRPHRRPRALTSAQERLFFALVFAAGLLLQFALL